MGGLTSTWPQVMSHTLTPKKICDVKKRSVHEASSSWKDYVLVRVTLEVDIIAEWEGGMLNGQWHIMTRWASSDGVDGW